MAIDPAYWLLLPVGVAIALTYTATGIPGANFWVPVFLLGLGLEPRVGFWLALVAMLFSSTSGLIRHTRQGTIQPRLAWRLLAVSVPAAIAGALVTPWVPTWALSLAFGIFALSFGAFLLRRALAGKSGPPVDRVGLFWPAAGGLLTGMISVGLGALLVPRMLASRQFEHHAVAVGTSLLTIFLTSLTAALARVRGAFVDQLRDSLPEILGVMVFVVPAVIVGGQLGPIVARRINRRTMSIYAALVLVTSGILMITRLVLELPARP